LDTISTSVPLLLIFGSIVIPVAVYAYLWAGEHLLVGLGYSSARRVRPWLWLSIPLGLAIVMLFYPLLGSLYNAFRQAHGGAWAGLDNFTWAVTGEMTGILTNTVVWLIVMPIVTVFLSLVISVLIDTVKYERLATTIFLIPTAISFTAASVVWRQIYSYQPQDASQLGLANALWTLIPGNSPVTWLQTPVLGTFALILVAFWASLGIAILIMSAAIKNVPRELIEAASIDGAGPGRIFFSITLPSIMPSVLVVLTTSVIAALKVFDIIYVMTNGNFSTNTYANRLYYELFAGQNLSHASAIAVLMFVVALPVIAINVRQFRREEVR
jgi:alpha-glucoside transport system permease protein